MGSSRSQVIGCEVIGCEVCGNMISLMLIHSHFYRGRVEGKMVSVWDATGVKMSHLTGGPYSQRTRALMKATLNTMQQHYPERSEKLFIINTPKWFSNIWKMISPIVDPATRAKICILGDWTNAHSHHICQTCGPINYTNSSPCFTLGTPQTTITKRSCSLTSARKTFR